MVAFIQLEETKKELMNLFESITEAAILQNIDDR